MSIEINVPDIGSDEVEITEIMVKVGDTVAKEQSLITVEGDKASMEVPSSAAGIVKEIKVNVGDKVSTGSLIMIFDEANATPASSTPAETVNSATTHRVIDQPIHVPDIGSDEVEVTEIMVNVGDTVTKEQSLITVEGDKASMEVPSPADGIVKEININVGDKVSTGSLIMLFAGAEPQTSPSAVSASTTPANTVQTTDVQTITVPDIGGDEVEITEILVNVGDDVSIEQSLITVEGDKASMEVPAPCAGKVTEILVNVGDKVRTGSDIMRFSTSVSAPIATTTTTAPTASHSTPSSTPVSAANKGDFVDNESYAHATPVIRRLAREFGINLAKVKGTGRKGRIVREDIQTYIKDLVKRVESSTNGNTGAALPGLLPWPKVDFAKFGEIEEIELTRIQKISGANLHRNWVMIPHVTQFDETDITELEQFRKQQNNDLEKRKQEVKVTPVVFIMKAVAKALEAMPRFNSSLSEDGQRLTLKKYINIGVAVDTPNGLVVPVFRDVNNKGIIELSRELTEISKKARAGKLTASDMQGGCFTISSIGGLGTTGFTPIVNAPEVAILGVSKSALKPVWNGKEFAPRLMLPLSLSFDHRVIDGADGARFISYISNLLADIRRLVM